MLRKAFVFAVMCITINAFSQYSINGKITDEKGTPLPGANIQLKGTEKRTVSDETGTYKISEIEQGLYSLEITFLGFEKIRQEVKIEKDYTLSYTMNLTSILGEEIIVKAIRAGNSVPVAYTNLDQEELEKRNLGQDIPVLLSLTPSFVTTSDAGSGIGYTGFRIRGTDANRINITVNGIPMNDAESHGVYWVNMPDFTSSVDNIQIQRGVGTSTYGAAAFGATVAIQTNTLEKNPFAEISSSAGSFNTLKNTVKLGTGLIKNHLSFDARLSKITSDGYIDRGWSDLKSYFMSGAYYTEKTFVKANVFSGFEHTYQAWNGLPSYLLDSMRTYNSCGSYTDSLGIEKFYNNETDNYQQDHYQLFVSHQLNNSISLNVAAHYTYGRGYYEEYKEDQDMVTYGLGQLNINDSIINTTDLIRQKWLDNDFYGFTFSANYKKNRNELTFGGAWNNYDGRHFGKVIWAQYMGNAMKDQEWYRGTGVKSDLNTFLKWNYLLSKGLNFYTDIQYRHIEHDIAGTDDDLRVLDQKHTFDFINPKIGFYYTLNDIHDISVFYALANREPNRSNYTDAGQNAKMPQPEHLNDFEASYNFHTRRLKLGVNAYYMYYIDQLILTGEINDVGSAIMTNADKSYRAGLELTAAVEVLDNLQWQVNTTLSRNKILNFTEYLDTYDTDWTWTGQVSNEMGETDLAFSPNVIANSQLSYSLMKNLMIDFTTQYVGKQYIDNTSIEDRILEPYLVNSLKVQYIIHSQIIKDAEIHLLINNIFNEQYENNAWVYSYYAGTERYKDDGYYPQAGINFLAGVTLKF